MKVYLPKTGHRLNYDLFADNLDIVDTPTDADIEVHWKTFTEGRPFAEQIVCQSEPPIVGNVRYTYRQAAKWHTFVTYLPTTPNAIPFSHDAPHLYPFRPQPEEHKPRPDSELRPKGNGVYFAGHRHNRPDMVTEVGCQIAYQKRAKWAETLVDKLGGACLGNGWPNSTKDAPEGWGQRKFKEMAEGDYDFIFAAENCYFPNYISEKFNHGPVSDRVTVYMGHKGIKKLVPGAFVYADDFDSPESLAFYLNNMEADTYRRIVYKAREFIAGIGRTWWAERNKCSMEIIKRIQTR